MTDALDNLVRTGQLKHEPPAQQELDGLIRSGLARLEDAENASLSLEGRFDLGYNAAHALSLAALRWHGYRSENRYIVFQALGVTTFFMNERRYSSTSRTMSDARMPKASA